MAEYIEREAAVQALRAEADKLKVGEGDSLAGLYTANCIIDDLPAADVAPVRHGRWEVLETYRDGGTAQRCSQCRALIFFHRTNPKKYCPNCGAKMDQETEE